jgi:Kef-type K+ transport system membrane component KefB/nucleotide-binding universal stress UspA family protein
MGERARLALLILVVTALFAPPARAADPPAASGAAEGAEVRAGSRGLFVLSGAVGSITAEERARVVNQRIDRILRDASLNPQEIRTEVLPDGAPVIALGNLRIVEVTRDDAWRGGLDPETQAEEWARILRQNLTQLQPLFLRQSQGLGVRTLSEHRVLLLILQVAVLLLVARLCGELALRLGQPPVIGQLVAGILLGQSILGALWPELKALVFPVEATQSYLLEVVSWIGVLFLLMLTGLETDTALIRQQGRPVLFVSVTGILVPFALGAGLGYVLPASLLTAPESRLVLALFLGTVLSVSSVPVIAKILLDMRLLRRNVGQFILAAALAHDTVGWIILGVVASLAAGGKLDMGVVARTGIGTLLFLLFCATLGRVLVRRTLRWVNDHLHVDQALMTAVVVLMMLFAATTQLIGVHAVLGAFVVGILLRETPVVNDRVLHPLETVTTAIFAPIFFAAAGLHVNLGVLADPRLLGVAALITLAAVAGKVVGCYAGARWAGSPHWDALSVGIGTNARGAMGLIVGIIGFSLGILTVDMFSLIIVMAVVTTAMTPPLLRWSLSHVKPGQEEEARLRKESLRERSFMARIQRVLLPTRGGEDAGLAASLVNAVAEQQPVEVTALYVQPEPNDPYADEALRKVRERLTAEQAAFQPAIVGPAPALDAILKEAGRRYDLLALGCGPDAGGNGAVFGRLVDAVAREAALPLLVVRAPREPRPVRHVLLPTATAAHSVQAAELAVAIARAAGARITALHVYEKVEDTLFWLGDDERRAEQAGSDLVEQVRSLGEAYEVPVETLLVRGVHAGQETVRIARERGADLIVMGGSARPTRSLFLGPTISTVLRGAECAVAVLRP